MLKKLSLVLVMTLLVAPTWAGAQEASATTRARVAASSTVPAVKLIKRQDQVRLHADQMFGRFNQTTQQLSALLARVNSRISKLEAQGLDVTKAKAAAAEAQRLITEANNSLDGFRAQVEVAASSTTPLKAFQPVRTSLQGAIKNVRQIQQKITEAIKELKKLGLTVTASTTAPSAR